MRRESSTVRRTWSGTFGCVSLDEDCHVHMDHMSIRAGGKLAVDNGFKWRLFKFVSLHFIVEMCVQGIDAE